MIDFILIGIVIVAVVLAIYFGTGGRAWFGTHEKPELLVGKHVQFLNMEWLNQSSIVLDGRVESFNSPNYRIVLASPFDYEGNFEYYVDVGSRHQGWPVSGSIKRPTPALATFKSGKSFWADLKVIE